MLLMLISVQCADVSPGTVCAWALGLPSVDDGVERRASTCPLAERLLAVEHGRPVQRGSASGILPRSQGLRSPAVSAAQRRLGTTVLPKLSVLSSPLQSTLRPSTACWRSSLVSPSQCVARRVAPWHTPWASRSLSSSGRFLSRALCARVLRSLLQVGPRLAKTLDVHAVACCSRFDFISFSYVFPGCVSHSLYTRWITRTRRTSRGAKALVRISPDRLAESCPAQLPHS